MTVSGLPAGVGMRPPEVPMAGCGGFRLVSEALGDLYLSSGRGETSAAPVGESGGFGRGITPVSYGEAGENVSTNR